MKKIIYILITLIFFNSINIVNAQDDFEKIVISNPNLNEVVIFYENNTIYKKIENITSMNLLIELPKSEQNYTILLLPNYGNLFANPERSFTFIENYIWFFFTAILILGLIIVVIYKIRGR